MATQSLPKSEELLGERWDQCLTDATIKMGVGFTVVITLSDLELNTRWNLIGSTPPGVGLTGGPGVFDFRLEGREKNRDQLME
eukprot:TCALIF_04231-PC protein Name:"Protein of unknown function" AED:0.48 eAED:0.48 QI:182/0/0.5/0.5/1/1/2/0/82